MMDTLIQENNYMKNIWREKFIVTADDFGISKAANENIIRLAKDKKLERVAVMSLGEISQSEAAQLKATGVKLDLHLDILHEYQAEAREKRSSSILRSLEFLSKFLSGKISAQKVLADWERQLSEFERIFGQMPDGINSHEHVHFFPAFFKLATELAKKHSIGYIRLGKNSNLRSNPVSIVLNIMRKIDLAKLKKSELRTSDFLISMDWIKNFEAFLKTSSKETELVCHPEIPAEAEIIEKYF